MHNKEILEWPSEIQTESTKVQEWHISATKNPLQSTWSKSWLNYMNSDVSSSEHELSQDDSSQINPSENSVSSPNSNESVNQIYEDVHFW